MPSNEGLKLLVSKETIDEVMWYRLIQARRALIKPHLDKFTLPELGSLECLRSEVGFTHHLAMDTPTVAGDKRFSLKTQGIFDRAIHADQRIPNSGYQAESGYVSCPDGIMYVWGLTRSSDWLLIKVEFKGEPGYKNRGYERAQTVTIYEETLEAIMAVIKVEPISMWRMLGNKIKEWTEFRERLYHQALDISRIVETEELLLGLHS